MADKSEAKKKMLGSLSKEMREMMGEGYGESLKDKMPSKVTVAGDSPEAVEEGLNLAEEIMKKKVGPMMDESDEDEVRDDADEEAEELADEAMSMEEMPDEMHEEMYGESHDEMMEDEDELSEESPEELKAKIEELQKKLAMLEE